MTLKEEFIKLGYTEEDYEIIRNNYSINSIKDETLIKKLKDNFNYLLKMGYTKEEVIKMTTKLPSIYGYSIENMKQKIEDMIALGYTKEEVIKITKSFPAIYSLSIENIKQKIEDIISLGYTKEEVIKMTKSLPPIYGLSIESMKQKIEDIIELGYTKEEVIKMAKNLPSIYGLSIENIKQKIEFYDSIGIHELAVINPKQLIQSVNLSYARYSFYKDRGIDIDIKSHKKLFIEQKRFEKAYGITKKELILKKINCDENQVINIISSNPMYLDRTNDGVLRLISKLKSYGFSMLNILFDSNPYILNLEVFEIENYINGRLNNEEVLEDIIDDLDSNPILFNEI